MNSTEALVAHRGLNSLGGEFMTNEELNQHYKACLDSVNLINADKPEGMDDSD